MVVFTSLVEQLPEDLPVYRVISFLQVNEEVVLPLSSPMDLIEQAACMDGSRLALLEACLIYLG